MRGSEHVWRHVPQPVYVPAGELIARQLGHRDVEMAAKAYGRFKPDTEERDRWEKLAGVSDAEKWGRRSVLDGTLAPDMDEARYEKCPRNRCSLQSFRK